MRITTISALGLVTMAGMVLHSTTVFGEEVNKADTKANFTLEAGDTTVPPEIIDPEVKPPTGNKGELTLDAVSNFVFPTKKIGNESNTPIEATVPSGEKLGVQVTDIRGKGQGWKLKVSATKFENKDKTNELKGAAITIPVGFVVSKPGVDPLIAPTALKATLSESPSNIMIAEKDKGLSSWTNLFEGKGEKVTISVPSGNKADAYEAAMTWTLEDAP